MIKKYLIQSNRILFRDGDFIEFKYSIDLEYLEYSGILIITLNVTYISDSDYMRNVYCIDLESKKILWQIERCEKVHGTFNGPQLSHHNPKEVLLWGYPNVKIDPYNGKIIATLTGYK